MNKDLYKNLFEQNILKISSNYVLDDKKDDFIPDTFRNQDYIFNLNENLKRLAQSLKNGTYRPRPLKEIDVPKSGLAVRPGSSLDIEDHIVYFAIAYLLAPIIDNILPKNVFHFRAKKKNGKLHPKKLFDNEGTVLVRKEMRRKLRIFGDWYEVWPEFVAEAQCIYKKEGFTFMVESDITAYFENISHPLLADILRKNAHQQLHLINLIMEMLSIWATPSLTGFKPQRGIPQGNEVSSWLGTLYLVEMDTELMKLQKKGMIKYVRYVDDIKVFTKDYKTARSIIFIVNRILRRLHLNMQSAKTLIFEGDEVRKRLYDERTEQVTKIIDDIPEDSSQITNEQKQKAKNLSRPIFKKHVAYKQEMEKENYRLFKRLLTLFGRIHSPMAIKQAIKFIWKQPVLTEKIAKYLSTWMKRKLVWKEIENAILGDKELFDTQYLYLLPMFRTSSAISLVHKKQLMRLGCGGAYHWAVRAEAFLSLILLPLEDQDYKKLRQCYFKDPSPTVKKTILSLFLKARSNIRNPMFADTIHESHEEINRFRKYLWALQYNNELGQHNLKVLSRIENDPARILVSLFSGMLSKNIETLKLIKEISKKHNKITKSVLARQAFQKITEDAQQMIDYLKKEKK